MNVYNAKVFLCVAQYKSISKAAEALFVSQPAISTNLRNLETELGIKLIRRDKGHRTISLTPEGETFIPIAEHWLEVARETELFKNSDVNRTVRIAFSVSLQDTLIPFLAQQIIKALPTIKVRLRASHSENIPDLLISEKADFGIYTKTGLPVRATVHTTPIFEENKALLCPKNTPLPESIVSPADLDPRYEVLVTSRSNRSADWHDEHFPSDVEAYAYVDSPVMAHHYLLDPRCWAICPLSTIEDVIKSNPDSFCVRLLNPSPPTRITHIAMQKTNMRSQTELFRLLCRYARNYANNSSCFHII